MGAMWLSVDPLFEKYAGMSPYNYCAGNPVKYIDPDGNVFETAWDLFNVALDIKSLEENLSNGNYGAAFVDGLSLIGDGAAVILPGVPGGFGTAVKAARATDKAIDVVKTADKVNDASKVFKAADKGADATKTAKNTAKSINAERQKAVRQAWKEEKVLVESGADGTRRWTKAEKKRT